MRPFAMPGDEAAGRHAIASPKNASLPLGFIAASAQRRIRILRFARLMRGESKPNEGSWHALGTESENSGASPLAPFGAGAPPTGTHKAGEGEALPLFLPPRSFKGIHIARSAKKTTALPWRTLKRS